MPEEKDIRVVSVVFPSLVYLGCRRPLSLCVVAVRALTGSPELDGRVRHSDNNCLQPPHRVSLLLPLCLL